MLNYHINNYIRVYKVLPLQLTEFSTGLWYFTSTLRAPIVDYFKDNVQEVWAHPNESSNEISNAELAVPSLAEKQLLT